MRVLLINGSPNERGCTFTALSEVAKSLNSNGIETRIIGIGKKTVAGCIGCGACKGDSCGCAVFKDETYVEILEELKKSDGLVVGTPVYYASANGNLISLLDRLFYSSGKYLQYKPACAIASARRAGTTASIDIINKYFGIMQMPIVSSNYWNVVHGNNADEVVKDLEGMQTMRVLGENMAWLLKLIENGKQQGIEHPSIKEKIRTNFIR